MNLRHLSVLCLAFGLLQLSLGVAAADKRVALLIGNSSYRGVTPLENPLRDVGILNAALTRVGFDKVETKVNLDRDSMIKTLRTFEDEANDADIAVIYFSGHGLEMNGENFLVPIDARLATDRDVEDETVTLSRMLRTVDGAKRLKLIILDACRNNPFLANMTHVRSTKSVSRGLVEVEPRSSDTLIAYAAKAGTVAWDGAAGNSPFAQALARHLVEPGIDIRLALGKVRDDVLATTNHLQEPFAYGSLGGEAISLAGAPAPGPATSTPGAPPGMVGRTDPCADASAHWAEARRFDRLDFYEKHVELFGSCPFGDFARARIEEMKKVAAIPIQPTGAGAKTVAECAFKPWRTYSGSQLYRDPETKAYLFSTDWTSLDADGAPTAYHPDDIGKSCGATGAGLDCPSNSGYPKSDWWPSVLAADPANPKKAYVQPSGPNKGYFVSKTALQDPDNETEIDPKRYVDSRSVPYIVFPDPFSRLSGSGALGDLGVAYHIDTKAWTPFVVGDIGPDQPLGAGSIALFEALSGVAPNPRDGSGIAPGKTMYLVFPGSVDRRSKLWPISNQEIRAGAEELLAQVGGMSIFEGCRPLK
jgi:hypothetical protein